MLCGLCLHCTGVPLEITQYLPIECFYMKLGSHFHLWLDMHTDFPTPILSTKRILGLNVCPKPKPILAESILAMLPLISFHLQGLFERHKLIVATQLCMSILKSKGELSFLKFDYLLRGPKVMGVDNPLADWVSDSVWGSVQVCGSSESQVP
jgi:hypothetical protein